MMQLTKQNYHTPEANAAYWSNSQYAEFAACPARAVAGLRGEYKCKRSPAFAFGGLLDRALTATPEELDEYMHGPESLDDDGKSFFFDQKGQWRNNADTRAYQESVARVKLDPFWIQHLSKWQTQRIFTGTIAGLPWKIMADFYLDKHGCETVADLKFMADFAEEYVPASRARVPWYDANGYFRTMATYRHTVSQETGKPPLIFLFGYTKQATPDAGTVIFDSPECIERFDREMVIIESRLPEFDAMKRGEIPAPGCDSTECEYCRGRHSLERMTGAVSGRNVTE
jgi:hypothetical protein